jgi:aspartate racemase
VIGSRKDRIILEELVRGVFKVESTAYVCAIIERMMASGCDAVALGCTELPLVIDEANSPIRTLDSTRLLAWAAVRQATGNATALWTTTA